MSADEKGEVTGRLRLPESEWDDFRKATRAVHAEGRSPRSLVLRDFIRWYIGTPGVRMPSRPSRGDWVKSSSE
ncbi:hypothetical protein MIU24_32425 [Streptomyces venezuelae]|uniref:hypothetical protein n=1 Tax=Streptomyces sp. B6(2022) TaxID=3404749 RepID=UPI00311E4EA2